MTDLVEFLLACIAEDEAVARAADKARWLTEDKLVTFQVEETRNEWALAGWVSADTRANVDHIASWDPARVLRRVRGQAEACRAA